jgi:hypothetical protein
VQRLNTLINDPEAPAQDVPMMNGNVPDTSALAGVLGLNPAGEANSVSNEQMLNSALAMYPGGPDAFWENMQGSGVRRDDFLQMLSHEMSPFTRYLT